MDSDLAWVNGKSGRQSWRYADAFQRSIISEAIYHFLFPIGPMTHILLSIGFRQMKGRHTGLNIDMLCIHFLRRKHHSVSLLVVSILSPLHATPRLLDYEAHAPTDSQRTRGVHVQ